MRSGLPAGASANSLVRFCASVAFSPAKRAERTPGAPSSAVASIPESSAMLALPVGRGGTGLAERVLLKRVAILGWQHTSRGAPRPGSLEAAARTRGACARCGWPAVARRPARNPAGRASGALWWSLCSPAMGSGRVEDLLLSDAQLVDAGRGEREQLVERGARRAGCARRWPAPRRGRPRRSSRRWRRPRHWSPRRSRGRAAPPATIPHETAAIEPVSGRSLDLLLGGSRWQASASAT